jgi:head-tail adaptor
MDALKTERLNRRIAVLRRGDSVDDGYSSGAPGEIQRLCWRLASVKPVRRREQFEAAEQRGYAELSCWLRFDSVTRTIAGTDLIAIDGTVYEIGEAPREVGFKGGIELMLVTADDIPAVDPDALAQWTA